MKERRKHPRIDAKYPVKAEFSKGWKKQDEQSRLENLCTGGIKFKSETRVKKGSEIEVEMNIPGSIVNSLLGIEGLDPDENLIFKSTGVVIRRENQNNGDEAGYVAVKFTGPLQIAKADIEKK